MKLRLSLTLNVVLFAAVVFLLIQHVSMRIDRSIEEHYFPNDRQFFAAGQFAPNLSLRDLQLGGELKMPPLEFRLTPTPDLAREPTPVSGAPAADPPSRQPSKRLAFVISR